MSRIKDSGEWKGPNRVYAKVSNAWQEVYDAFAKVSGAWRRWLAIVPNVVGQDRSVAESTITARGFTVGNVTQVNTTDAGLDEEVISQSLTPGDSEDVGTPIDYTFYEYIPPFFPPYFPPFFPPYFPPYFPPFFPPYFPPFFPPYFPPFFPPWFKPPGVKSVGMDTLIRTPDGLVAAGDLEYGDMVISAKIEDFPYQWTPESNQEALDWFSENPDIELDEAMVVGIERRISEYAIIINNDIFSGTHYILVKRNGEAKFVDAKEVEETDLIYSYDDEQFEEIFLLEIIEAPHEVICINVEPYDLFFTENMLVHDSHKMIEEENTDD